MEYFQKDKEGKRLSYKFQSKKEEETYIGICRRIWGCVPCEVLWAVETQPYKSGIK
jgi:hypothetical protein